jgi:hypothetical protein
MKYPEGKQFGPSGVFHQHLRAPVDVNRFLTAIYDRDLLISTYSNQYLMYKGPVLAFYYSKHKQRFKTKAAFN